MKWTELHTQLHELMKQEIDMMKQLLANMHQEEIYIVNKDRKYWPHLMEERSRLIYQISTLRQNRVSATESLESTLDATEHPVVLEDLLPPDHENSWEILALRDQMLTLLDRINLQTSRNEMLTQIGLHQNPENKKKITLATLPEEDYKEKE